MCKSFDFLQKGDVFLKKSIKTVLIIIFFICFLGLFFSNSCTAFAIQDYEEMAYQTTNAFFAVLETNQQTILSQFFTYAYVSVVDVNQGVEVQYDYCLVISKANQLSNRVVYTTTGGSGYYIRGQSGFIPRIPSVSVYADHIIISGNYYYFDAVAHPTQYVIYCDLPTTYYNDHTDPLSLQHILLPFNLPAPSLASSKEGTLEDVIKDDLDRWQPQIITTVPPFSPPATVPPIFPPAETVTALPAVTDDSNNYYIDYSPYIDGNFYAPPTTEDISLSPALSASGAIISEGFGWLTDSGVFSVLLVLMLVSFAIYNLI